MKAEEFIREKENEVFNLFKDWHLQKLAYEMEEYAKLYHKEKLNQLKNK